LNVFNQLSIWLSFQVSIIFLIGIPFTLYLWAIKKRNKAINKLLSIYWKISLLFFISLFLLIGKFKYALIITNISTILMTISVWFWNDINDELKEYNFSYSLTTTTKVWRWALTFISLNFFIQSLQNFNCLSFINTDTCAIWLQPSSNLYTVIKNLFNFFFGANFTQTISKFLGLFSLLIYILGLIQWLIVNYLKMEETPASQKMAKIDLINSLEKISSEIPDRILKLEGFILKKNQKEQLEIIIFRGYSSSTTHPIEIDSEKKVITLSYSITNFKLYKAPLTDTEENFIRENQKSVFFLNQKNWI